MRHPDYDRAFHETPDYIRSAIELGLRKGRRRMELRRRAMGALTIAAALAVVLGAAAFGASRLAAPRPDNRALSRPLAPAASEGSGGTGASPTAPGDSVRPGPSPELTAAPAAEASVKPTPERSAAPASPEPTPELTPEPIASEAPAREATALASPTPTAEAPSPGADSTAGPELPLIYLRVRVDEGADPHFHLEDAACGRALPVELSLATALWEGYTPCPDCVEGRGYRLLVFCAEGEDEVSVRDGLWCTPKGNYLHVRRDCSGMKNAQLLDIAGGFASGKRCCPACMGGWACALALDEPASEPALARAVNGELAEHLPGDVAVSGAASEAVEMEVSAAAASAASIVREDVYFGHDASRFHRNPSCGGEIFRASLSLRSALELGMEPCEICLAEAGALLIGSPDPGPGARLERLWYTGGGVYFHSCSDCSGMRNASPHPLLEAFHSGKRPCPVCLAESEGWSFAVVCDPSAGAETEIVTDAAEAGGQFMISVAGAEADEAAPVEMEEAAPVEMEEAAPVEAKEAG